jgi:hypothetical protein
MQPPEKSEMHEDWRRLCEAIVVEQDHTRLLSLVEELNRVLERRETELRKQRDGSAGGL